MNYDESIQYIHGTLKFGSKLGLQNISILLDLLGNPHNTFPSIHVGGTNGKGSTCAFLASILREAGNKVGFFISPYLERFTERIQINGEEISEADLARITTYVREKVEQMIKLGYSHPTEFEIVTAIGFCYFYEKNVDIAVIEVGLGGRLDSTNVIKPLASVITSISYDHMDILGNTIEQIAYEKAGIIKERGSVILYPQEDAVREVVKKTCEAKNAELYETAHASIDIKESTISKQVFSFSYQEYKFEDLVIAMTGRHQILNAATALIAAIVLNKKGYTIHTEAIEDGLRKTRWPGRLEVFCSHPFILLDGAHNEQGVQVLRHAIEEYLNEKEIILITGMLRDKEVSKMAGHFAAISQNIILTTPDSPRAMEPSDLARHFSNHKGSLNIQPDIKGAIHKALRLYKEGSAIVIAGSLYLVGKARNILKDLC